MATALKNLSSFDRTKLPEDLSAYRLGLVVAEWNAEITTALADGARAAFLECGVSKENIVEIDVPGSFELVAGAKMLLSKHEELDAVVVIGSVIRGETSHFDFVCQGASYGISHLNATQETPVIFCVLTDDTWEQAKARSGGKHGNKGVEAAVAAIQMAALRKS